jgi:hypothetical protein
MSACYETDFYLWTQQQAGLLRQGLIATVDIENIAEEIESMGKSERHALGSYLKNILMHLLKWQYQPERRGNSWKLSIINGRDGIERSLEYSPSLAPQLTTMATAEYRRARKMAAAETGLPLITFPDQCPFTVEQITGDYWPD